jgi:hypothetical protein
MVSLAVKILSGFLVGKPIKLVCFDPRFDRPPGGFESPGGQKRLGRLIGQAARFLHLFILKLFREKYAFYGVSGAQEDKE